MTFGVEFGLGFEVSKQGAIVRTEVLPFERFQKELPMPPAVAGPGKMPPVKKG
jgi:hypothetical protein